MAGSLLSRYQFSATRRCCKEDWAQFVLSLIPVPNDMCYLYRLQRIE